MNLETLSLYCCNAHSLAGKKTEFSSLMNERSYDILLIAETWFTDTIGNGMFDSFGQYNVYRKDRGTRGGGVAAFVRKGMQVSEVPLENQYKKLEVLCLDISGDRPFRVVLVYRGKPELMTLEMFKVLCDFISDMCDTQRPIIIAGDFNYPYITWGKFVSYPNSESYELFMDTVTSLGLEQFVLRPTRTDPTSGVSNFLDLVFCTDEAFIFDVKVCEPVLTTDHSAVVFRCQGPSETTDFNVEPLIRDYDGANWDEIKQELLRLDWRKLFGNCETVQDFWNVFVLQLESVLDRHVPYKRKVPRTKSDRKNYPAYLKRIIRRKRRLHPVRNSDDRCKAEYAAENARFRKESHRVAAARERKILASNDRNKMFNYVRRQRCNDNGVGPLKQ